MKDNKMCQNCKYHEIEEITFDSPQSICCRDRDKGTCYTTEKWLKCDDFQFSNDFKDKEIVYPEMYYLEGQNEQLYNYFLNRLKDLQELKESDKE